MGKVLSAILAGVLTVTVCAAQDADRGVIMPFTVSGGVLVSERARAADPEAGRLTPGFRAVAYPSLKINSNWFAYSALQVQSEPYFYYDAFYPEREIEAQIQQLFLGYSRRGEDSSFSVKVGKLPSAFGAFPPL